MAEDKTPTEAMDTNQGARTVALESESPSADVSTGNADDYRARNARTQGLESVDFYMAQGYADIATDTLDLLERQFGSHPEIDQRRLQLEKRKLTAWDDLEKAFNEGIPIKGRVIERIKGGLRVDVEGIPTFLPGSQVDVRPVRNLDSLRGRQIDAKVIKLNRKRSNVVLSRKAVLEERNAGRKGELPDQTEEDIIVEGQIKNLTDYGALVDLGGVDGLLHVTDMSWGGLQNPGEFFKVGDTVQVKVMRFDRSRERVSLGYKHLLPDQRDSIEERSTHAARLTGKANSVTETTPDELMMLTISRRALSELSSKTAETLREAALALERIAKDREEIELFKTETREVLKRLQAL